MSKQKQAICIVDLGFGDAGKGTITDYLSQQLSAHTIIRYNGGPQAAHNVVTSDGRHHTFSQFGSGMLHSHTKTLLSRFMLVNPLQMLKEERHLRTLGIIDALSRTQIDRRSLIITPFQKAANRLREIARGTERHGSCGEGIGECMADALKYGNAMLYAGDLQDRAATIKKLRFLHTARCDELAGLWYQLPDTEAARQERAVFTDKNCIEDCADIYEYFSDCVEMVDEKKIQAYLAQTGSIIFEGAQGVLLDENYGFAPYTTWSTTTLANAETLLQEYKYEGEVTKMGILRTYTTRHGAGPFPTEDHALARIIPDPHNTWNGWQHTFRVGYLDLVAARYAKDIVGELDCLALTHLDRLEEMPEWKVCNSYSSIGRYEDMSTFFEMEGEKMGLRPSGSEAGRGDTLRAPFSQADSYGFQERTQGVAPTRLASEGWRPGKITKIKVHQPVDLAYQEELTQRLWSCVPEYETIFGSSSSFVGNAMGRGVSLRPPRSLVPTVLHRDRGGRKDAPLPTIATVSHGGRENLISQRSSEQYTQKDIEEYISLIEEALDASVAITSCGPTAVDKKNCAILSYQRG